MMYTNRYLSVKYARPDAGNVHGGPGAPEFDLYKYCRLHRFFRWVGTIR